MLLLSSWHLLIIRGRESEEVSGLHLGGAWQNKKMPQNIYAAGSHQGLSRTMPNVGRPSRDCHECRRRRVKCDLGRPECARCLDRGRPCPGYRDELQLRFRIENVSSFPSNMSRDRRRKYDQESHESDSSTFVDARDVAETTSPEGFLLSSKEYTPLLYPLTESWNDHCVPLVINKFSFDTGKSVYNAIPHVASKAEEGSPLYLACNAVGCAYIANSTQYPSHLPDQSKAYRTALNAVYSALSDPQRCKSDNTILGVWLLALYELLLDARSGAKVGPPSSGWDIHSRGMAELIRLRGPDRFTTREGRNLFWIVFNTVQIHSLVTGQESPKETPKLLREISKHCESVEYTLVRAGIFSYHCNQLCSRIQRLINTGDLDHLLSNTPTILRDLDNVEKVTYPLPDDNPITACVVEPPLAPYPGPDHIDLRFVGVYSFQCCFRMQLASQVLDFLHHASEAPSCTPQQRLLFTQVRNRCIEDFRAVANKILFVLAVTLEVDSPTLLEQLKGPKDDKNLSRILGWPDTIRVLWPVVQWSLRLIASSPISLDWQKSAAQKVLEQMNCQLGIMRALGTLYFEEPKKTPQLLYAEFPISTTSYDSGFRKVNFEQLANAINGAAWHLHNTIGPGKNWETLAYIGPNDLRYNVLVLGAVKAGYKTIIVPNPQPPVITRILAAHPLQEVRAPTITELLDKAHPRYPYNRTFEEAKDEPLIVFHTSGSTGMPKPVIWSHDFAASYIKSIQIDPPEGFESQEKLFQCNRVFFLLPPFHAANHVTTLFNGIGSGTAWIYPPASTIPSAKLLAEGLKHTKVDAALLAPSLIGELGSDPEILDFVCSSLDTVLYGGGDVPATLGNPVAKRVRLLNEYGSSEQGSIPEIRTSGPFPYDDWKYIHFHPDVGVEFVHVEEDMYELCRVRKPQYEWCQPIFKLFSHLDFFRSGDLFSPHPSKPDLWTHRGCGE
ncbi:hypothetical protein B7463_g2194, partial [Scytalidium lignicola]